MFVYWDVETYSECDLEKRGAYVYATDKSTDVLLFCYAIGDSEIRTWKPGDPVPAVFANPAGHKFVSDNWDFERQILVHVLIPRYGFVPIPVGDQDCAQRLALANAYPAKLLDRRCEALGLPFREDKDARAAMRRLSQPAPVKKPTKRKKQKLEDPTAIAAAHEHDRVLTLERCKNDVAAARAAYNSPLLKPLLPQERDQLLLDAKINARGIRANIPFLSAVCALADKELDTINSQLTELTEGAVTRVTQAARIMKAVNARGHNMATLGKRSVAITLAHKPDNFTREVLTLRQQGASTVGYTARRLLAHADPRDSRIRGGLRIFSAGPGRWSSPGPQLHGLNRNDAELPSRLVGAILAGNRAELTRFGGLLRVMANLSRAGLCAAPGHKLICADFGAIESRVLAWYAGETWKLDGFRQYDETRDERLHPYRQIAAQMLRKDVLAIAQAERQMGKSAELAFGFGGVIGAWRKIVGDDGRSDAEIKTINKKWRAAHPQVVKFWDALARAARRAIRTSSAILVAPAPHPPIIAAFDGRALTLTLPSGRAINYPDARVVPNKKFEDADPDIEYLDNAKGQWVPKRAWFGTLVENVVQGTARDLLAAALLRFEARDWNTIFHCHDEIVVEVLEGSLSDQDVLAALLEPPAWAIGLPLGGKVHSGSLYLETVADKSAPIEAEPKPQAQDVDWDAALEREFPRAQTNGGNAEPIAAAEPATPQDGDAYIRARLVEEGIPWEGPAQFAQTMPPSPEAPTPSLSPANPTSSAPRKPPTRGNGHGYPHGESKRGHKIAEYVYLDQNRAPYHRVDKYEWIGARGREKSFPQYYLEDDEWAPGAPDPMIPYRLPELLAAPVDVLVLICEGEKDCITAARYGFIATCNPGGAKVWQPELTQYFRGKQQVCVVEDHDGDGERHTELVTNALRDTVPTLGVLRFPELPANGDLTDFFERGGTKAGLLLRIEDALKIGIPHPYIIHELGSIPMTAQRWLWPEHLPIGALELTCGQVGIGKGLLLCDLIARVTTGRDWPDGSPGPKPGSVIILTAEDRAEDYQRRLTAAGADLHKAYVLEYVRRDGRDELFLLAEDLDKLEQACRDLGDTRLIGFDPITAYMGTGRGFDSHRATDVRAQLHPLKVSAEKLDVAFSAITHPPKNASSRSVLDNFIGSQAFIAAARSGHYCIEELGEEDDHGFRRPTGRVFYTVPKFSHSAPVPTLVFRKEAVRVGTDPTTREPITAARVVWEGPVGLTANEAIEAHKPTSRDGRKARAAPVREFLRDTLASGPTPRKTVIERGAEEGFSFDQLRRARETIGVVSFENREPGHEPQQMWALAKDAPKGVKIDAD